MATTREFTAMGDTVNVAARLESAAPPGGVLISHDTYRHIRGVFDVQQLEPLTLKGKSKPLVAYSCCGRSRAASAWRPAAWRVSRPGWSAATPSSAR